MKNLLSKTFKAVKKAWMWYAEQYCNVYMPPII